MPCTCRDIDFDVAMHADGFTSIATNGMKHVNSLEDKEQFIMCLVNFQLTESIARESSSEGEWGTYAPASSSKWYDRALCLTLCCSQIIDRQVMALRCGQSSRLAVPIVLTAHDIEAVYNEKLYHMHGSMHWTSASTYSRKLLISY